MAPGAGFKTCSFANYFIVFTERHAQLELIDDDEVQLRWFEPGAARASTTRLSIAAFRTQVKEYRDRTRKD